MRYYALTGLAAWLVFSGHTLGQTPPPGSAYSLPHNYFGAHLLVSNGKPGTRGDKHLRWARHLVGRWGFAKTLFANIDKNMKVPQEGWTDYIERCYELELIPFIRLGGRWENNGWVKPEPDDGYRAIAQAVQRVVSKFPRSDKCPLYIEVWNEPNLDVEWSGKSNHEEYAAFFVQVAKALRDIGDPRIRILNGGLATSAEWARKLCEAQPDYIRSFDYYSVHPYPMNRPPSFNHHDKTIPADSGLSIDGYLLELAELARFGRKDVKVVITETGYDLGNAVFLRSEGHPIIDEYNRADYIVRALRDYWPSWPEVFAVTPFEFSNEGWQQFDWVYPDSGINEDGSPTKPHYQYTAVAALAKPTDSTGAINGTVTVKGLGTRIEDVRVGVFGQHFTSDPMGNYFLARLRPGNYSVQAAHPSFRPVEQSLMVRAGKNTVWNIEMEATRHAVVSGLARSGDTGRPLSGVRVRLEPGDVEVTTDSGGRFKIEKCIPTQYTLTASLAEHHEYRMQGFKVIAGKSNRLDFVLGERKAPDSGNMLNNAGMEAGGGGSAKEGIALGFEMTHPDTYRDGLFEVSDKQAHTGRLAQGIAVRSNELQVRQITHYGTARPETTYTASAWIKTDCPGREDGAWITLDATDNGGGVIQRFDAGQKVLGRTKSWVWVSIEGKAPARSQRLSLNLHTKGSGGTAWFDDVYVGPVTAGEK